MRGSGTPLTSRSGNQMPYTEKQAFNGTARLPTNSTAMKPGNKTPLTPRMAGSKAALTSRPRHDGTGTPTAPSQREELSTPVSTFLSNNITPRSSSRKTRGVDSESNTPTGSPALEQLQVVSEATSYTDGIGIIGPGGASRRPATSFSPAISELASQREQSQSTMDSKFFFASDAKTAAQPARRPVLNSKSSSSTFLYANGEIILPLSSTSSAVGSTIGEEKGQPRLFPTSSTTSTPSPSYFPLPSSNISIAPHITSPRFTTQSPTSNFLPPPRSTSPRKAFETIGVPSIRPGLALTSAIPPRITNISQRSQEVVPARRVSIKLPTRPVSLEKSPGSSNTEPGPALRRMSIGIATPPSISPAALATEELLLKLEEPSTKTLEEEESITETHSPIKAGHSLEHMNELAANARRERKVLDLEITNSSLAAINRTLERQLRKQTAELRRFRRLSRTGRLSIATAGSMRNSSLSMIGSVDSQLSDESEDEDNEDDDESSEEDFVIDGSLSPRAMAESDARHRKRDEKRLKLDLSKHQELLVDSQKMNQSLKRCLGWTEELINEGKKALAYHILVSDVELGGRVLAPDELEDNENDEKDNQDAGIDTNAGKLQF